MYANNIRFTCYMQMTGIVHRAGEESANSTILAKEYENMLRLEKN